MAKVIQLKRALMKELKAPVILYDGVCNFCNAIVNFIIRKDEKKKFLFAPIQSREARILLRTLNEPFASLKTVYLIRDKKVYKRSRAVFKMLGELPHPWKLLSIVGYLPLSFTDLIYRIIARNRYHWFGKSGEVIKPDAAVKERFLTG